MHSEQNEMLQEQELEEEGSRGSIITSATVEMLLSERKGANK